MPNGYHFLFLIFLAISRGEISGQPFTFEGDDPWYLQQLAIPDLDMPSGSKPVVIAVVDDGFRLSHLAFKEFLYRSPEEFPANRLDDDGNGYTDDHCGWDVADGDNDVSLPAGREPTFYHGTFLCGVIADILTRTYGPRASDLFKILPVKAISDASRQTYVSHGYQGIAYAVAKKADLVLCAWNGGTIGPDEARLLAGARTAGSIIVASVGNFYGERSDPPASDPNVIAIAAVDSTLHKIPASNYGQFVDLSGPGYKVIGAGAESDRARRVDGATSAASAVVAAALAILRREKPDASTSELLEALKNTATPLDTYNLRYPGKLGSGFPNLRKAVTYLHHSRECCRPYQPDLPSGTINGQHLAQRIDNQTFEIRPAGAYQGAWFNLSLPAGPDKRSELQFFALDGQLAGTLPLDKPARIFVPGNGARVFFHPIRGRQRPVFRLDYYMETIDSTTIYCRDTRIIENEKGVITDGSGEENYANACDCKWQLFAPEGYRIRLRFPELDTQAQTDFVYVFDGTSTIPENMIARFSGPAPPPEVISRTNQVLIWFVADADNTGKGWRLEYQWVK